MTTFQTNTLQFLVTGRLGGTERNPRFSIDPTDPDYVRPDAQNLYRFTVEELGVLDLSLAPGSPSLGIRFVPFVWIDSPVAPVGAGNVEVVDSESLTTMRVAFSAPGLTEYFRNGIKVPQGGSLRFADEWVIPPGRPLLLRVEVVPARNTLQWAQMHKAFCCLEAAA